MIKLETDSLEYIINSQSKLMVMFGTDWCGNCDILKPEFDRVSKEHTNIPFILVNPDNLPKSRSLVDLTNIPMVVAFRDGKEIFSKYGNKSEIVTEVLNNLL